MRAFIGVLYTVYSIYLFTKSEPAARQFFLIDWLLNFYNAALAEALGWSTSATVTNIHVQQERTNFSMYLWLLANA
jgi:hypothetical protein